jgi:hypothetical protein
MAKNGKTGKVVGVGNGIGTGSGKGTVTATIAVADSPSEKKAQNQKPRSRMTADEIVKEAGEFAKLPMEERWQAQKSGKFTGFLPNDLIYAENLAQRFADLTGTQVACEPFIKLLYNHQFNSAQDDIQNFSYCLPRIGAVMDWVYDKSNYWQSQLQKNENQFCIKFDTILKQYDKYYEQHPIKPHQVETDFVKLSMLPGDDEGETFKVEDEDDPDGLV